MDLTFQYLDLKALASKERFYIGGRITERERKVFTTPNSFPTGSIGFIDFCEDDCIYNNVFYSCIHIKLIGVEPEYSSNDNKYSRLLVDKVKEVAKQRKIRIITATVFTDTYKGSSDYNARLRLFKRWGFLENNRTIVSNNGNVDIYMILDD